MRSTEPLLEVEMPDYLKMKIPFPRTRATLKWMGSRLMMVMTVTGCIIKWRSQVESENVESWLWFLSLIKQAVVCERPNMCVLHDRHKGILSAVKKLQEDRNIDVSWLDLHSWWCMRHMGANFYSQFRSKRLEDLFKKMCKQT